MKKLADVRRGLLVASVLVMGACSAAPLPNESVVTGLHFTTSSAFAENPRPTNVDVTLTAPTPSRAIYDATMALPDFPSGRFNCPADFGYTHTIIFMTGQGAAVTATLNMGGCRDATISGSQEIRQTSDTYWALVAQNLGVDEATLFSIASP